EDAHVLVERRVLGQVADAAPRLDRLLVDVVAADLRAAARRRQVRGEDLHGGGLAGAVRADEAEHLTGAHFEGDRVDRWARVAAVVLGQLVDANHGTLTRWRVVCWRHLASCLARAW